MDGNDNEYIRKVIDGGKKRTDEDDDRHTGKIIGITGAVGSGKSSLLSLMVEKFPIRVIKADELGHEIYKKDTEGYREIIARFGKGIVDKDGEIDRKSLGNLAFKEPGHLEWLNLLIHPYVRKRIEHEADIFKSQSRQKVLFIESAILLEHGYEDICDEFWYVHVSEENRRERLKRDRGYSKEKTEAILKNQMPETFFISKCKVILDNNGKIEDTLRQITHFLDPYVNVMLY